MDDILPVEESWLESFYLIDKDFIGKNKDGLIYEYNKFKAMINEYVTEYNEKSGLPINIICFDRGWDLKGRFSTPRFTFYNKNSDMRISYYTDKQFFYVLQNRLKEEYYSNTLKAYKY